MVTVTQMPILGVRGAIVLWVIHFLSDRRQCVRYNQTLTDYAQLHAGVSQGTKIGPITFHQSMMLFKTATLITGNMWMI